MAEKKPEFNEKSISNMTYSEILEKNRESRKGTFMDRTWRDSVENILEDESLTKWQKFKSGGYTFRNVNKRFQKNLDVKQKKIKYM